MRTAVDRYRFYVPNLADGQTLPLPDDEAHHALHVLRLTAGAEIEIFDGRGGAAPAIIEQANKKAVTVRPTAPITRAPQTGPSLTIATAMPKGDRAQWLIEQCSQLNVTRILWLECDRNVVKFREDGGKFSRLERYALEAAKQCGRNWLMQIDSPTTLEQILQTPDATAIWWCDPRATQSIANITPTGDYIALIGPEGGWSEREWNLLSSATAAGRIQSIHLGPNVLRIETACAAIAAITFANSH